ncbi:MAG: GntR family transcriptional regulator [Emergencia sp.]|nr:GntR family transcriptional regulator [Emergencia sp.]
MFEAVENKTISEIVIEQIQKKIITGELKVGDQLAPERELVQDLDISRSTLREALKALEVMGVIQSKRGNGSFVVNNTENSVYKPLSLSFVLSNGKNEDIMEARRVIEGYTASKAAEKATEEDVQSLYAILDKIDGAETVAEKSRFDEVRVFLSEKPEPLAIISQMSYNKIYGISKSRGRHTGLWIRIKSKTECA